MRLSSNARVLFKGEEPPDLFEAYAAAQRP
jgi:hypothetical protein